MKKTKRNAVLVIIAFLLILGVAIYIQQYSVLQTEVKSSTSSLDLTLRVV